MVAGDEVRSAAPRSRWSPRCTMRRAGRSAGPRRCPRLRGQGDGATYFAGDTSLFPEMHDIAGHLDMALLPVGGWGPWLRGEHMNPKDAANCLALLDADVAVPIHYGTFWPRGLGWVRNRLFTEPGTRFAAGAQEHAPEVDIRVLSPGTSTTVQVSAPPSTRTPRDPPERARGRARRDYLAEAKELTQSPWFLNTGLLLVFQPSFLHWSLLVRTTGCGEGVGVPAKLIAVDQVVAYDPGAEREAEGLTTAFGKAARHWSRVPWFALPEPPVCEGTVLDELRGAVAGPPVVAVEGRLADQDAVDGAVVVEVDDELEAGRNGAAVGGVVQRGSPASASGVEVSTYSATLSVLVLLSSRRAGRSPGPRTARSRGCRTGRVEVAPDEDGPRRRPGRSRRRPGWPRRGRPRPADAAEGACVHVVLLW